LRDESLPRQSPRDGFAGRVPSGGGHQLTIRHLVAVVAIVLSVTTAQAADRDFVPVNTETGELPAIVQCLRQEKEAVLLSNGVECTDYRKGAAFLVGQAPNTPFNFDADRDCSKNSSRPADARHLSEDAIQRLLSDPKLTVRPSGIRIFGAIFCERVKLVGLELPFSLVLDKSVFAKGIEIRNVRVKGDVSFDSSLILDQLRIIRSHIEGTLFWDKSYIQRLQIGTSTIDSSASFTESVLLESTQIFNVAIAKEFSIRGSALSYFVAQFSTIGEILDLSHSQARCAYHINKSEIGYLVARKAGFGTVEPPAGPEKIPRYYVWREDLFSPPVEAILSIPEMQKTVPKKESCINQSSGLPYRAEFFVFDSNIKSSLCVSEFRWLGPRDGGPYAPAEFLRRARIRKNI
jgi:hypothetical protein